MAEQRTGEQFCFSSQHFIQNKSHFTLKHILIAVTKINTQITISSSAVKSSLKQSLAFEKPIRSLHKARLLCDLANKQHYTWKWNEKYISECSRMLELSNLGCCTKTKGAANITNIQFYYNFLHSRTTLAKLTKAIPKNLLVCG